MGKDTMAKTTQEWRKIYLIINIPINGVNELPKNSKCENTNIYWYDDGQCDRMEVEEWMEGGNEVETVTTTQKK